MITEQNSRHLEYSCEKLKLIPADREECLTHHRESQQLLCHSMDPSPEHQLPALPGRKLCKFKTERSELLHHTFYARK